MNRKALHLMAGILIFSFLTTCSGKKDPAAGTEQTTQTSEPVPADNLPAKLDINSIPLAEVEKIVKMIEADPTWLQQIKDKAAVGNVPIAIQLKDDARFFLFEHQAEYGIVQIPEEIIQTEIEKIKADAAWLQSVASQAKERAITMEECLRRNALYVIDQRMK